MLNIPTWQLWAAGAVSITVLSLLRYGVSLLGLKSSSKRLDMGGIALDVLLSDLNGLIIRMQGLTQPDPELMNTAVLTTRTALDAFLMSSQWKGTTCPVNRQRLGESIVDAMKLADVGSEPWAELKRALDLFQRHFA